MMPFQLGVGTLRSLHFLTSLADLFPRDRSDVGNVPTHAGKRFHRSDYPEHDESDLNDRGDDRPEKYEDAADRRNCAKNCVDNRGNDIEQKPGETKDDRL